jgi:hypothetical protein
MKALTALTIVTLLVLAGCSSPAFYWYHPERTIEEAKADFGACQDQACQKAADVITDQHYDRVPPPAGPAKARGLSRDPVPSAADPRETQQAWRERYEQGVLADCMRERGYLKLSADRVPPGVRTHKLPHGAVAGR